MKFFIFSSGKAGALAGLKKDMAPELLPLEALAKHRPGTGDLSFLDISGLGPAELKKALGRLKKVCAASAFGIIDPRGEAPDPAAFFFEGAADYLGPKLIKAGPGKKRLAAALAWRAAPAGKKNGGSTGSAGDSAAEPGSRKLPGGKFEGWKSIRSGAAAPFFFLYAALSGPAGIRTRLQEAAVRNRLRETLLQNLQDSQALLWMETESSSLFLIPPRAVYGKAAVEAGLKMLAGSRLIALEKLGLSAPVEITMALHYGKTVFRAPGATGTVVSDAVNYIFHLGAKHAEPGRLTISADVSDEAIPEGLKDMFLDAGAFEGIPIRRSRRFTYSP
jgi:hypothetical protein